MGHGMLIRVSEERHEIDICLVESTSMTVVDTRTIYTCSHRFATLKIKINTAQEMLPLFENLPLKRITII